MSRITTISREWVEKTHENAYLSKILYVTEELKTKSIAGEHRIKYTATRVVSVNAQHSYREELSQN